jgi:hypothetical protein
MDTSGYSAPFHFSQERIWECEGQGALARRENHPIHSHGFFPGIERKAFERGWEREDQMIRQMENQPGGGAS